MSDNPFKKISPIESVLIIFSIILLILFCIFLMRNVQTARQSGVFDHRTSVSQFLLKNKQSNRISITDTDYIDTWMTFQYINFVFNIPETYLKDQLQITDTGYPKMTIGKYIKNNRLDKAAYTEKIKETVREYISLHPTQ